MFDTRFVSAVMEDWGTGTKIEFGIHSENKSLTDYITSLGDRMLRCVPRKFS